MPTPASIRTRNPGAIWGSPHTRKWGATDSVALNDGTGQGNTIAVFPSYRAGACAQFDLWRKSYTGISLAAAIRKWSGGNSSIAYVSYLSREAGIPSTETITDGLLAGTRGLALMKAQARWEAGMTRPGQSYPTPDDDWKAAQDIVFRGQHPQPDVEKVSAKSKGRISGHVAGAAAVTVGTVIATLTGSVEIAVAAFALGVVLAFIAHKLLKKD